MNSGEKLQESNLQPDQTSEEFNKDKLVVKQKTKQNMLSAYYMQENAN